MMMYRILTLMTSWNTMFQASMLSLLPDQRMILQREYDSGGGGAFRPIQILGAIVDWFRTTFSAMAADATAEDDSGLQPSPLEEQAASALRLRAGTPEVLVMLFVALIRAMGLPVRYVRLMDVLPIEPWKRRPSVPRGATIVSPQEVQQRQNQQLKQQREQPVGQRKPQGKLKGNRGESSSDVEDITESVEKKRKIEGQTQQSAEGIGGGKGAVSAKDAIISPADSRGGSGATTRNRGEEEFERQLQLAMMATEAEAQARQAKGSAGSGGGGGEGRGSGEPSASIDSRGTTGGPSAHGFKGRVDLFRGMGGRRKGGARGGGARGGTAGGGRSGAGASVSSSALLGGGPLVWAEVFCGSADAGKWVHADVLTGSVNRWGGYVWSSQHEGRTSG